MLSASAPTKAGQTGSASDTWATIPWPKKVDGRACVRSAGAATRIQKRLFCKDRTMRMTFGKRILSGFAITILLTVGLGLFAYTRITTIDGQ